MDLPLLLAGPILRRVEPALVSVWVALRDPRDVRLKVWEGQRSGGQGGAALAESAPTRTLRVGAQLHLATVTIRLPATSGVSFQPDSLYSYDLSITEPGATTTGDTLDSLHMLEDGQFEGFSRLALGMAPGALPSFSPPPAKLTDLNLVYGSCRRPGHPDPDALAMVDNLIFDEGRHTNPTLRPHQLFLGGDQVYADDVETLHMLVVQQAALSLIGTTGSAEFPDPIEHLPLDHVLLRQDETKARDPNPLEGYVVEDSAVTAANPLLPADRRHFPEGRRLQLTLHDAQLTSSDGANHILSLGEFAALYLSVWSQAVWGTEVVGAKFAADASAPGQLVPLGWDDELPPFVKGTPEEGAIVLPAIQFPERIPGHLYVVPREPPDELDEEEQKKEGFKSQRSLRGQFAILQEFRRTLPKVQRALANVPTYMILDDHDITDDFFLNPAWRSRVLGTKLGKAVLDNAMIAYALFQDWGNDPAAYDTGPKAQLLGLVEQLFPAGSTRGPDTAAIETVGELLGHDEQELTVTPDGRFGPPNPALKWHFTVDGPKHRAIVLDNRTRRSFGSRMGPPGNVSADAMVEQIPLPPLPADREILVVVAPLQVIGPSVLDELVAPLSYRVFDAIEASSPASELDVTSTSGLREMTGTAPDAIEAWAFDAQTFELLLKRLEPYGRVVLLSGDVHYSSGTLMSYWRGSTARPARFAQFTSSGFKNVMPAYITFVDASFGFAQQLIRFDLGAERLGWDQPLDDMVLLPAGTTEQDLRPVMRSRLGTVPVRLPTWGWPDLNEQGEPFDPAKSTRLNPAKPPDWRWRVKPLLDKRADDKRPKPIQPLLIDQAEVDAKLDDPSTRLEGYQQIAARHQHALERLRNARQILFRANVGRLRFEQRDVGQLDAIHEIFTAFTDPGDVAPSRPAVEPYLVQVAALGPEDEEPPTRLRQRALEVP